MTTPLDAYLIAFTTFFATIGPLDLAVLYAGLTADDPPSERARMAKRGVLIGAVLLLVFLSFGEATLALFGVGLPALRTAGGLLLFVIAFRMVFASDRHVTTEDEETEARASTDVSVFPLAIPLIAGPGAMGAAVLLASNADGDPALLGATAAGLFTVLALLLGLLLGANRVQKLFGVTAIQALTRVFGVILAGLAVQFVFDGLAGSGLFGPSP